MAGPGAGFRAGEGAINKGAGVVANSRQEMARLLQSLRAEVEANAASWQGRGALKFRELMTRWDEDSHLMLKAMDEFADNLRGTDRNYQTMDAEADQRMTKLQAHLG